MPMINGRLVNIPNGGIYGSDLINAVAPTDDRRAVKMTPGGFETIEKNKRYTSNDLVDRQGRPIKITSIPDRTKGSVGRFTERLRPDIFMDILPIREKSGFDGRRDELSKRIITEQVYDIAEKLFKGGVDFDEDDANWFVVPKFVLPRVWWHISKTSPLMICFPTEYPVLPPIGCYLKADIPQAPNGHFYADAYHDAWKQPLAHGWKWYCVYVQPGAWQPASVRHSGDWRRGDNLWTYMTLINEALSGAE